ncbi:phytoene dehydrogenase-like protein [Kitasatospora sp. SolWspMP-SS2h]|uniref:phytoene desaturase family protein n=1 Tax=Kitasatospora sp. SolWspMP-SS2h TaxID=1305729 RepID=UPI000DBA5A6C|nr:NAD(P)/FAD-dependent oxidoreductase [Kitasatospora sp. SolWspMP-SS2h]RAJ43633.1 phytoene dehydrogenase-like protein [Kitasatospora sp. SolWspMP-SS2h]
MARIIVVGAGMGGLAAASRLGASGHRVVVLEAAGTHGGQVGAYRREGFGFDTGPGLLALPAVYRDLALKTGREPLEELVGLRPVDPESRHLFPDGTELVLPNASRGGVGQALDAAFGAGAGARWGELVNRGRTVWEATRRPLLEEPRPAVDPADPYPVPPRRGLSRLLPRGRPTLADAARELGGGPGPAALLGEYALRYGLDPRSAPASATVLPYMEQSFGVWYVDGGLRALADAVFARCGARGVEFRFGTPVRALESDGGRVVGVRTDEGVLAADAVLSAVPGLGVAEPTAPAPGRFTVLLALDGARPAGTAHRTVVHAADGAAEARAVFTERALPSRPTVQVLRPDDPSLVPGPDAEAVVLTVTVPAGLARTEAERDAYAGELLDHLAAAGLDLRPRLRWRETRLTGSVPVPSLAGGHLAQANRPGPPGLYLIGAHAHPGGGLARVGMSASITAGLVGPA